MTLKSQTANTLNITGCGGAIPYFPWLRCTWRCDLWNPQEGDSLKWAARMKVTGLCLAKIGSDDITSSFVPTRANLFPS